VRSALYFILYTLYRPTVRSAIAPCRPSCAPAATVIACSCYGGHCHCGQLRLRLRLPCGTRNTVPPRALPRHSAFSVRGAWRGEGWGGVRRELLYFILSFILYTLGRRAKRAYVSPMWTPCGRTPCAFRVGWPSSRRPRLSLACMPCVVTPRRPPLANVRWRGAPPLVSASPSELWRARTGHSSWKPTLGTIR